MSFPNFKPTKIEYIELSDFGSIITEDQEGIEHRTNAFTQGKSAKVSAKFVGLNSTQVLEFIDFYKDLNVTGRGFGIPESFKTNQFIFYESVIKSFGQVILYFEKRPSIETEFSDIYSVTLYMIASIATISAPEKIYVTLQTEVIISASSSTSFVQWSQISGNPVTFSNPNDLVTNVISQGGVFNSTGGKIFFKVALLDNPDVFTTIEIVPAPSSFDVFKGFSVYSYFTEFSSLQKVLAPLIYDLPYSLTASYKKNLDINTVYFRWNPPSATFGLVSYKIETYNNGWINLGSTVLNKFNVPAKTPFRIISCYTLDNNNFEIPSDLFYIDPQFHLESYGYAPSEFENLRVSSALSETFLDLKNSTLLAFSTVQTNWSTASSVLVTDLPLLSSNLNAYQLIPNNFLNRELLSSLNAQLNVVGQLLSVTDLDLGGVIIG
jgi:hypothetical protein